MSYYDDLTWEQLLADPTVSVSIGFIDMPYYRDIYHGQDVSDLELTKLIIRSSDDINAKANWNILDMADYTAQVRNLIYKATASQVEWYVMNGEAYNDSGMADVTISKFSYTGKIQGSSKNTLCSRANMFMAQTGLMNRDCYIAEYV